jgi:hypothetical protein
MYTVGWVMYWVSEAGMFMLGTGPSLVAWFMSISRHQVASVFSFVWARLTLPLSLRLTAVVSVVVLSILRIKLQLQQHTTNTKYSSNATTTAILNLRGFIVVFFIQYFFGFTGKIIHDALGHIADGNEAQANVITNVIELLYFHLGYKANDYNTHTDGYGWPFEANKIFEFKIAFYPFVYFVDLHQHVNEDAE